MEKATLHSWKPTWSYQLDFGLPMLTAGPAVLLCPWRLLEHLPCVRLLWVCDQGKQMTDHSVIISELDNKQDHCEVINTVKCCLSQDSNYWFFTNCSLVLLPLSCLLEKSDYDTQSECCSDFLTTPNSRQMIAFLSPSSRCVTQIKLPFNSLLTLSWWETP